MALVGVKFTSRDEEGNETPFAEFRLQGGKAVAISGQNSDVVRQAVKWGVSESQLMLERVASGFGVTMPAGKKEYVLDDGVQFLVALLAEYKGGNAHVGVHPVEA